MAQIISITKQENKGNTFVEFMPLVNRRIVILGAGESGVGTAVLAKKQGFDVFVSDLAEIQPQYKDMLLKYGIEFEEKQHTEELIFNANEVVKSPGIPDKVPIIKALKERNIPIISEIEFAARYTKAKKICITGSNGKTTTTMLTYFILKNAGLKVGLAGNVGKSFALQVAEETSPLPPPKEGECGDLQILTEFAGDTNSLPFGEGRGGVDYYVLELSSFQLDGMYDFKADIAIITNITPDHLDRYDYNFQNYINSKFRILQNQTEDDYFIFWSGDPVVQAEIAKRKIRAKMVPFDLEPRTKNQEPRHAGADLHAGAGLQPVLETTETHRLQIGASEEQNFAFTENDQLIFKQINKSTNQQINNTYMEMLIDNLAIKGTHNLYNSMAAGLAAQIANIQKDSIRKSLENFTGVEHRMEYVVSVRGVRYINDSKATNVNSCWYALQSMQTPVVLILGGTDKGNDYTEIAELVREKVHTLIFLGVDNEKLKKFFSEPRQIPYIEVRTMKDAVAMAYQTAKHGDTVLLSPCCASFDLFKNYEDRGTQFKELVRKL